MIDMNLVRGYYPPYIRENANFDKHLLKEYIQLMILDFLSSTPYMKKLAFIGGTNLRLVKGIDRFSEDLDFDCKDMEQEEFMQMTDDVLLFLHRNGLEAIARDKENSRLSAFRRNIYFPQLLFDMGLSHHKDERFLIKIEAQDQNIEYHKVIANVRGCGLFFPLPVPPDAVLCSMKLSALLMRAKGRDFYDAMFLLGQTSPDFEFLKGRCGIGSVEELKSAVGNLLKTVDLHIKERDFEHLLFNRQNAQKITRFGDYIQML